MLWYQHTLCASIFLCIYFLFGTYIFFISAKDLFLCSDFMCCMEM
jgi:hypothetical protein